MNSISHILRSRRLALGLTLDALARAARCSKAYLSGIENSIYGSPPSAELLTRLERALQLAPHSLTRLADWQRTPKSIRADLQLLQSQIENPKSEIRNLIFQISSVPLLNKVAAGSPAEFTDLDYPAGMADERVPVAGLSDPHAFALKVTGDSMLPSYREGDTVIFSPARTPADGSDCLVRLLPDHHTTFKRVEFLQKHRLKLLPLNPKFKPMTVALQEVSGLWPAVFVLRKV